MPQKYSTYLSNDSGILFLLTKWVMFLSEWFVLCNCWQATLTNKGNSIITKDKLKHKPLIYHLQYEYQYKKTESLWWLKDHFQSTLCTLASLFAFFVMFHVRHHNMWTFCNYLHEVNSKFQNNCHYGCEAVKALYFVLSHITWWNNFATVKISEAVGKNWKAPKIRYLYVVCN